jgi:hypothetical protein
LGIVSLAPAQFPKAKSFQRTAAITGSAIADLPEFAPVRELQPRHAAVSRKARAWGRSYLNARALYSLHRSCPPMAVAVALNLRPQLVIVIAPNCLLPSDPRCLSPGAAGLNAVLFAGNGRVKISPPAHDRIEMG